MTKYVLLVSLLKIISGSIFFEKTIKDVGISKNGGWYLEPTTASGQGQWDCDHCHLHLAECTSHAPSQKCIPRQGSSQAAILPFYIHHRG